MTDIEWYDPLVEVKPSTMAAALPKSSFNEKFSKNARQELLNFAESTGTKALLIWHMGGLSLEWYGDGFDRYSYMESASMHKSVLVILYGIAIDKGCINSIDEKASKYITEWQADNRKNISIRDMLQMASGLGRIPGGFSPFGENMQFMMGSNSEKIALEVKAEQGPGKSFAYSNLNSQLLGILLERACSEPYAKFLQDNLWSKVAESSSWVYLDRPDGLAKTSGSLFTPARNWLRLGLLYLNEGSVDEVQVVPKPWLRKVITPSRLNPNYGLHIWLGTNYEPKRGYGEGLSVHVPQKEAFLANDVIYFDGAQGQRVYIVPSKDLVIVRTGDGGIDFQTGAFSWDESELPNMVIRGLADLDSARP